MNDELSVSIPFFRIDRLTKVIRSMAESNHLTSKTDNLESFDVGYYNGKFHAYANCADLIEGLLFSGEQDFILAKDEGDGVHEYEDGFEEDWTADQES